MKEAKIKYKNLSDKQKKSIEILIQWVYQLNIMYRNDGQFNLWSMYNFLKSLKNSDSYISAYDMKQLRDIWDCYVEYLKMSKTNG
jgi:hypothetical protein